MIRLKNILFSGAAVALTFAAAAQTGRIDDFRRQLAQGDPPTGARVTVSEDPGAAAAVKQAQAQTPAAKVRGYRVRIFFDNGQFARQKAGEALAQFRSLYPGVPVYLTYENPYFKVSAGNCITSEEAVILWGNVKNNFDRAFVVREDIPLSAMTEAFSAEPAEN